MSIAEDLRKDADDALSDGGMYYSGEYLNGIAKKVEAIAAENRKLRELVLDMWQWMCRARYDRSVRDEEMDEMGVRAVKLGIPDYELGIEVG